MALNPWWAQNDPTEKTNESLTNPKCGCDQQSTQNKEHFLIINVSPLGAGHVLLTPFVRHNQPQIITLDGLRLALDLILLSRSP